MISTNSCPMLPPLPPSSPNSEICHVAGQAFSPLADPRKRLQLVFEGWAAHTTLALDTVGFPNAGQLWHLPESCRGTTFPATLFSLQSWLSGAWPIMSLSDVTQPCHQPSACPFSSRFPRGPRCRTQLSSLALLPPTLTMFSLPFRRPLTYSSCSVRFGVEDRVFAYPLSELLLFFTLLLLLKLPRILLCLLQFLFFLTEFTLFTLAA